MSKLRESLFDADTSNILRVDPRVSVFDEPDLTSQLRQESVLRDSALTRGFRSTVAGRELGAAEMDLAKATLAGDEPRMTELRRDVDLRRMEADALRPQGTTTLTEVIDDPSLSNVGHFLGHNIGAAGATILEPAAAGFAASQVLPRPLQSLRNIFAAAGAGGASYNMQADFIASEVLNDPELSKLPLEQQVQLIRETAGASAVAEAALPFLIAKRAAARTGAPTKAKADARESSLLRDTAGAAGIEGVTEVLQGDIQNLSLGRFDPTRERTMEDRLNEFAAGAVGGGGVALGLGGAARGVEAASQTAQNIIESREQRRLEAPASEPSDGTPPTGGTPEQPFTPNPVIQAVDSAVAAVRNAGERFKNRGEAQPRPVEEPTFTTAEDIVRNVKTVADSIKNSAAAETLGSAVRSMKQAGTTVDATTRQYLKTLRDAGMASSQAAAQVLQAGKERGVAAARRVAEEVSRIPNIPESVMSAARRVIGSERPAAGDITAVAEAYENAQRIEQAEKAVDGLAKQLPQTRFTRAGGSSIFLAPHLKGIREQMDAETLQKVNDVLTAFAQQPPSSKENRNMLRSLITSITDDPAALVRELETLVQDPENEANVKIGASALSDAISMTASQRTDLIRAALPRGRLSDSDVADIARLVDTSMSRSELISRLNDSGLGRGDIRPILDVYSAIRGSTDTEVEGVSVTPDTTDVVDEGADQSMINVDEEGDTTGDVEAEQDIGMRVIDEPAAEFLEAPLPARTEVTAIFKDRYAKRPFSAMDTSDMQAALDKASDAAIVMSYDQFIEHLGQDSGDTKATAGAKIVADIQKRYKNALRTDRATQRRRNRMERNNLADLITAASDPKVKKATQDKIDSLDAELKEIETDKKYSDNATTIQRLRDELRLIELTIGRDVLTSMSRDQIQDFLSGKDNSFSKEMTGLLDQIPTTYYVVVDPMQDVDTATNADLTKYRSLLDRKKGKDIKPTEFTIKLNKPDGSIEERKVSAESMVWAHKDIAADVSDSAQQARIRFAHALARIMMRDDFNSIEGLTPDTVILRSGDVRYRPMGSTKDPIATSERAFEKGVRDTAIESKRSKLIETAEAETVKEMETRQIPYRQARRAALERLLKENRHAFYYRLLLGDIVEESNLPRILKNQINQLVRSDKPTTDIQTRTLLDRLGKAAESKLAEYSTWVSEGRPVRPENIDKIKSVKDAHANLKAYIAKQYKAAVKRNDRTASYFGIVMDEFAKVADNIKGAYITAWYQLIERSMAKEFPMPDRDLAADQGSETDLFATSEERGLFNLRQEIAVLKARKHSLRGLYPFMEGMIQNRIDEKLSDLLSKTNQQRVFDDFLGMRIESTMSKTAARAQPQSGVRETVDLSIADILSQMVRSPFAEKTARRVTLARYMGDRIAKGKEPIPKAQLTSFMTVMGEHIAKPGTDHQFFADETLEDVVWQRAFEAMPLTDLRDRFAAAQKARAEGTNDSPFPLRLIKMAGRVGKQRIKDEAGRKERLSKRVSTDSYAVLEAVADGRAVEDALNRTIYLNHDIGFKPGVFVIDRSEKMQSIVVNRPAIAEDLGKWKLVPNNPANRKKLKEMGIDIRRIGDKVRDAATYENMLVNMFVEPKEEISQAVTDPAPAATPSVDPTSLLGMFQNKAIETFAGALRVSMNILKDTKYAPVAEAIIARMKQTDVYTNNIVYKSGGDPVFFRPRAGLGISDTLSEEFVRQRAREIGIESLDQTLALGVLHEALHELTYREMVKDDSKFAKDIFNIAVGIKTFVGSKAFSKLDPDVQARIKKMDASNIEIPTVTLLEPRVQEVLRTLPSATGKATNLFSQFITAIADLLGLKRSERNLLSDIVALTEGLIGDNASNADSDRIDFDSVSRVVDKDRLTNGTIISDDEGNLSFDNETYKLDDKALAIINTELGIVKNGFEEKGDLGVELRTGYLRHILKRDVDKIRMQAYSPEPVTVGGGYTLAFSSADEKIKVTNDLVRGINAIAKSLDEMLVSGFDKRVSGLDIQELASKIGSVNIDGWMDKYYGAMDKAQYFIKAGRLPELLRARAASSKAASKLPSFMRKVFSSGKIGRVVTAPGVNYGPSVNLLEEMTALLGLDVQIILTTSKKEADRFIGNKANFDPFEDSDDSLGFNISFKSEGLKYSLIYINPVDMKRANDFLSGKKRLPSGLLAVETVLHEFGHSVEKHVVHGLRESDPAMFKAVVDGYKSYVKMVEEGHRHPLTQRLRPHTVRDVDEALVKGDDRGMANDYLEYVLSFPEWIADNVKEWTLTAKEPRSVLEKFFSGIADFIKEVYNLLIKHIVEADPDTTLPKDIKDHLNKPNEAIVRLLDERVKRFREDVRFSRAGRARPGQTSAQRRAQVAQMVADEVMRTRGAAVQTAIDTFGRIGGGGKIERTGTGANAKRVITIAYNIDDPLGAVRHETMHDFMDELSKYDAGAKRVIDNIIATSTRLREKMASVLTDMGELEAVKQLDDPMERAAYLYQLWAAGHIDIRAADTRNYMERLKALLVNLFGILTQGEKTQLIFEQFQRGELKGTSEQNVMRLRDTNPQLVDRIFEGAVKKLEDTTGAIWIASTDRIRDLGVPAFTDIANLIQRATGEEQGEATFLQERSRVNAQWLNRFNTDVIEGTTKEERAEILRNWQLQKSPVTEREKKLRKLMSDSFKYMQDAGVMILEYGSGQAPTWVPIREVQNYVPQVWDAARIVANEQLFEDTLVNEAARKGVKNFDRAAAKEVIHAIKVSGGMTEGAEMKHTIGFIPMQSAASHRRISFIKDDNAHLFEPFMEKDIIRVADRYLSQMAHRGEFSRIFGGDGAVLTEAIRAGIGEQGATQRDVQIFERELMALFGTLGSDMKSETRHAMAAVVTVQNLITLPLAIFSQLVDPIGIAIRSGEMRDAWAAYRNIFMDLYNGTANMVVPRGKSPDRMQAEFLGIVQEDGVFQAMGYANGAIMMGPTLTKINRAFFKYNLMQGFSDSTRTSAMVAGELYIRDWKNDSEKLLELGLKKSDVIVKPDGRLAVTPDDIRMYSPKGINQANAEAHSRKMAQALNRFVDSAIIRPSAAHRPGWMSDPRWMLVAHLKQWAFSFHNVTLKRVKFNLDRGENMAVYRLAMFMPVMLAAEFAKYMVVPGYDVARLLSMDIPDLVAHSVERAGVLGIGSFFTDAMGDIEHGNAIFHSALGPTYEHIALLLEGMFGNASAEQIMDRTVPFARFF